MTHLGFLLLLLMPQETGGTDWTRWGGPRGDFVVDDAPPLAEDWGEEGPRILWKQELGPGHSSILRAGDTLYTAYRVEDVEVVVALDAATGETLWDQAAPAGRYDDMHTGFGEGPNSTPLLAGDRLVHSDIAGKLRCLDLEGDLLWEVDLHERYGRQRRMEEYGYSGNHLLQEGKLIVLVGGDVHGAVALDPEDGSLVWGSEPFRVSYAPPAILRMGGMAQLVLFSPTEVLGLDPDDGTVLWRHPVRCKTENNLTAALLCDEDRLWISSQFEGGTRLLRILRGESGFSTEEEWSSRRVKQCHWNSVLLGDYLYGSVGTVGGSRFSAVNWRTGEVAWDHLGLHAAQCIQADGKLVVLDEEGELALLRVSPEGLDVLALHPVAEGVCWAPPTLVGGTLYLRNDAVVMALDLAASSYR